MKKYIYLFTIASLLFTGCSKDSSTTPEENQIIKEPTVKDNTLIGVFKDGIVQGLTYETTNHSGVTNDKGEFSYEEGESVTFKVGNILLGSTTAKELITPINLVKEGLPEITNPEAKNIAALLQTLDSDANHSNGITIIAEVTEAISTNNIDFSKPIEALLADIVAEVSQKTEHELIVVLPEQAAVEMALGLGINYMVANYTQTHLLSFLDAFFSKSPKALLIKHVFDEAGKIISSEVSYRYSGRKIATYNYSDYQNNLLPTTMIRTPLHPLKEYTPYKYAFSYNDDFKVATIEISNTETHEITSSIQVTKWDDKNRIIESNYSTVASTSDFYRKNTYNDQGFLIKRENSHDSNKVYLNEYFYDQWGNFEYLLYNQYNAPTPDKTTFLHRENHTRESTFKKGYFSDGRPLGETTSTFDEKEYLILRELKYFSDGDQFKYTYNKGLLIQKEYYDEGTALTWVENYTINGTTYTRKYFYSQDDYIYYIEHYQVEDSILLKTEYYDANNTLIRTEYPESNKRNSTRKTRESPYYLDNNFINEYKIINLNY